MAIAISNFKFQIPRLRRFPSLWRERRIITILLMVLAVQFVNAQKMSWSLQDCINLGLEHSLDVKIEKLEVKRMQKSRVSLIQELLPTVNLFGSQSYNFGSTIDPGSNARVSSNIQFDNFYMNAQMNLIDLSAIANAKKSKIAIEIAEAEQKIIENEYKLQILESFYQALFTQQLVYIQQQQLVNTQSNLTRISKEIEIGSKPKSDLYDIQFSFAQEEKQVLETAQLYEMQKLQLFQLLNADHIENIKLVFENVPVDASTSTLANPKITAAQLKFKSAKKELLVQRAKNLPTLSTFYQLSSFYYRPLSTVNVQVDNFSNQLGNNKNQQLGFQLAVPVFNGFKNNRVVSSAKIELEKSKVVIEQERLKLNQQLEIEEKNQQNFLVIHDKLLQMLDFAQASFRTTQAKFSSGIVDAFSFAISKNNLLSSEYNLLKNTLQQQYTTYKLNLIRQDSL